MNALYTCTSLLVTMLVELLKMAAGTSTESSMSGQSGLSILCTSDSCRNGQCYVVGDVTRCVCDEIFSGDQCQYVNLDEVTYAIIGTIMIFQWTKPPRLKDYAFVYYEIDNPELILYKHTIEMKENDDSVLVGDLKGGRTRYRICIEDEIVAERAVSTLGLDLLTNCMDVITQPDYHTLAAWCLAFMLSGVAVLLMYSQRDKIEILYFNKPVYIPMDLQESLAQDVNVTSLLTDIANTRLANGTHSGSRNK